MGSSSSWPIKSTGNWERNMGGIAEGVGVVYE